MVNAIIKLTLYNIRSVRNLDDQKRLSVNFFTPNKRDHIHYKVIGKADTRNKDKTSNESL